MLVEVRPKGQSPRYRGRWWPVEPSIVDLDEPTLVEVRADGSLNVRELSPEEIAGQLGALHEAAEANAVRLESAAKLARSEADALGAKLKAARSAVPQRKPQPTPYQDAQRNARPHR